MFKQLQQLPFPVSNDVLSECACGKKYLAIGRVKIGQYVVYLSCSKCRGYVHKADKVVYKNKTKIITKNGRLVNRLKFKRKINV